MHLHLFSEALCLLPGLLGAVAAPLPLVTAPVATGNERQRFDLVDAAKYFGAAALGVVGTLAAVRKPLASHGALEKTVEEQTRQIRSKDVEIGGLKGQIEALERTMRHPTGAGGASADVLSRLEALQATVSKLERDRDIMFKDKQLTKEQLADMENTLRLETKLSVWVDDMYQDAPDRKPAEVLCMLRLLRYLNVILSHSLQPVSQKKWEKARKECEAEGKDMADFAYNSEDIEVGLAYVPPETTGGPVASATPEALTPPPSENRLMYLAQHGRKQFMQAVMAKFAPALRRPGSGSGASGYARKPPALSVPRFIKGVKW